VYPVFRKPESILNAMLMLNLSAIIVVAYHLAQSDQIDFGGGSGPMYVSIRAD